MAIEIVLEEVENLNRVFDQCVKDYHIANSINAEQPAFNDEKLLPFYSKCWVDSVQWHLEDEIRRPEIDNAYALELKRRIDASNQVRTNQVEGLDDLFLERFKSTKTKDSARINTESPAWAIDRLSILALKLYHMKQEAERSEAGKDHMELCHFKWNILKEQRRDLTLAIAQLLEDLQEGNRVMKVYRQMKMYNDPKLNPSLYSSKDKG